jgi:uroporphyrinogen decarboxylase
MNSKERLKAAIYFEEPDRVPLDICGTTVTAFSKIAFTEAMKFKGISPDFDPYPIDPIQQIVIPDPHILQNLNIDTYRIGARRIMDFENKVVENKNQSSILDPYRCMWQMKRDTDLYYNQKTYPLYDFDLLSDALHDFELYDLSAFKNILAADIDYQLKNLGERAIVLDRNCAGLTEMSLRIRGYDKWFMDTVLDPDGVERLLDMLVDHKIQYWDLMAKIMESKGLAGEAIVISEADDLGTQSSLLLDPETLRSRVIPKIARLNRFIKSKFLNAKIFFHTDGAIKQIIPDLIEAGVDILNPIQYSAADMDLKELKSTFGKDIVFWGGGIDTQEILNKGSVDDVRDEVKKNIEILAPGGGFIFSTVHNIQPDVPPQNFWAMWETLMQYGKYQ